MEEYLSELFFEYKFDKIKLYNFLYTLLSQNLNLNYLGLEIVGLFVIHRFDSQDEAGYLRGGGLA